MERLILETDAPLNHLDPVRFHKNQINCVSVGDMFEKAQEDFP